MTDAEILFSGIASRCIWVQPDGLWSVSGEIQCDFGQVTRFTGTGESLQGAIADLYAKIDGERRKLLRKANDGEEVDGISLEGA